MRAAIFLVVVWLATILVTVGGIAVLNQVVDLGIRWAIALPIAEAVAGLAVCLLAGVFSTPVARQSTARKGR